MTRIHKAVFTLAAVVLATGWAATPAAGQLSAGPGWVPGQPIIVTVEAPRGTPLMVVYIGRIPVTSDVRVALFLPGLEDTGLAYAVSTLADPSARRTSSPDPRPDGRLKRGWRSVGGIHTLRIPSPANPAFGKNPGTLLEIGAAGLDHSLVPDLPASPGVLIVSGPVT